MRWFRVNQGRRSFVTAQPRGYAVNWWLIKKRRTALSPNAPNSLAVSAYTDTTITLTWTDNSDSETGFKVERSPDGVSWGLVHTSAANVTTWQDTGLSSGQTYYYRVYAFNGFGNSDYSNVVSQTTVATSAIDFGKFEYWQANELLPGVMNGRDSGDFEYWQANELLPTFGVL